MYFNVSFIHPIFHLYENPKPPLYVGDVTIGHAVDSSATTIGFSTFA